MSEHGQALFNQYLLELLASAETRTDLFEVNLVELAQRAVAADMRQGEIERRLGELRVAFAQRRRPGAAPGKDEPD